MRYTYTLILLFSCLITFGQTKDLPNSFTYKLLGIDTYSPYLEQLHRFDQQTYGFSGTYNRYLNQGLSLSFSFRLGEMNYPYDAQDFYLGWSFYAQDVALKYNFLTLDNKKIRPYISGGVGLIYIKQAQENWEAQFPVELGVNYQLLEGVFLQLSTSYRLSNGANAWHNGIGIQFCFNENDKPKISSKRSISSERIDTKISSVLNDDFYITILDDHHKSEIETMDSDKDGIPDVLDACPNTYGDEFASGCPVIDTDDDGLADHEDRCPDLPGMLEFAGCPDTDGDRIPDFSDLCPNEAGVRNCKGCPDTDGDNIPNRIDKCPTEKGRADNYGCPLMKQSDVVLKGILKPIFFEYNSHSLDSNDFPDLDYVIQIMMKYPMSVLSISGIAYDSDNSKYNEHLSIKRAKKCYEYLIKKGIQEERITYQGLGNTKKVRTEKLSKSVEFQLFIN